MRINRLWAIHKWLPVAKAMAPMLNLLTQNSARGCLGVHTWVRWREVLAVQYRRSFEDLENFARRPTEPHLQAWKDFNQQVGSDGSVGIWHETYIVDARQFECVYGNMRLFGPAAAAAHVAAVGNRETPTSADRADSASRLSYRRPGSRVDLRVLTAALAKGGAMIFPQLGGFTDLGLLLLRFTVGLVFSTADAEVSCDPTSAAGASV